MGKWVRADTSEFQVGQLVFGKTSSQNSSVTLFRIDDANPTVFAASNKCFLEIASESAAAKEPARWFLFVAGLSWQESVSLNSSVGAGSRLTATTIGFAPGIAMDSSFGGSTLSWGFSLSGAYLKSQVSSALEQGGIDYNARNADVFAGFVAPRFLWRPERARIAIGLEVPLVCRIGNWPEPPGYALPQKTKFLVSPMLEARLERESWSVSQKMGLFGSVKNLIWMLQINYRL